MPARPPRSLPILLWILLWIVVVLMVTGSLIAGYTRYENLTAPAHPKTTIDIPPPWGPDQTETPPPRTPEEQFNARAAAGGWADPAPLVDPYEDGITPARYMVRLCAHFSKNPPFGPLPVERMQIQWKSHPDLINEGVPVFCPDRAALLAQAKRDPVHGLTREIGYDVPYDIPPGAYRTRGPARGCVWSQRAAGGAILSRGSIEDNSPARVTVELTADHFDAVKCGTWDLIT